MRRHDGVARSPARFALNQQIRDWLDPGAPESLCRSTTGLDQQMAAKTPAANGQKVGQKARERHEAGRGTAA